MPRKRVILKMPDGRMATDRTYIVRDVGPVVQSETDGETGHFDLILYIEAAGDPERAIRVPLVFLPSATRGSLWKNGILIGHDDKLEERDFIGVLNGRYNLITGQNLYDAHFLRNERQTVLDREIEINSRPDRRAIMGPQFLETWFAPLQHGRETYYFPSDLVFTRFFFGSHLVASKILGGQIDELYSARDSGWRDGRFFLECRGLSTRDEEFAIARLVSSRLGLAAMEWVHGALVRQSVRKAPLRIQAYFPVEDRCHFRVAGHRLDPNAFLVHRVLKDKGLDSDLQITCYGTRRQKRATDLNRPNQHAIAPAPTVPEGAQLQPDSQSEGNSAQKAAAIDDEALSNTYANSRIDRKIEFVEGPGGSPAVPQTPLPIEDTFSTAMAGSSPSALPKGATGTRVVPAAINFDERPQNHIDQKRSVAILRGLVNCGFRCLPLVSDEALTGIVEDLADRHQWLFSNPESRQLRRIHLSVVGSQYEWRGDPLRDCIVVDFERSDKGPAHFFVLHAIQGLTSADAVAIVALLGSLSGKLRSSSPRTPTQTVAPRIANLQTHQILDEAVEFKHERWGEGRYGHQSKKTGNAIRQFWSEARRARNSHNTNGPNSAVANQ